jgi:hypothetical protein
MRAAVFLAFNKEAGNGAENLLPGLSVGAHLGLSRRGLEGTEQLVQQVAQDRGLGSVAGVAQVANSECVVHAHVELHKASHGPGLFLAVEALQHQQIAPVRRAAIATAAAGLVRMGQDGANRSAQGSVVGCFGRPEAIGETLVLLHGKPDPPRVA